MIMKYYFCQCVIHTAIVELIWGLKIMKIIDKYKVGNITYLLIRLGNGSLIIQPAVKKSDQIDNIFERIARG